MRTPAAKVQKPKKAIEIKILDENESKSDAKPCKSVEKPKSFLRKGDGHVTKKLKDGGNWESVSSIFTATKSSKFYESINFTPSQTMSKFRPPEGGRDSYEPPITTHQDFSESRVSDNVASRISNLKERYSTSKKKASEEDSNQKTPQVKLDLCTPGRNGRSPLNHSSSLKLSVEKSIDRESVSSRRASAMPQSVKTKPSLHQIKEEPRQPVAPFTLTKRHSIKRDVSSEAIKRKLESQDKMIARLREDIQLREQEMKKAQDKMSLKINRLQNENTSLKKSKPVSRVPFNMSTTQIQDLKASPPKRNVSKLAVFHPTKAKEAPSMPVESEY